MGELLDEMDCMNQERLEHLEERQRWERERRAPGRRTEKREKKIVDRPKRTTSPVVVVEKSVPKIMEETKKEEVETKNKDQFTEKKFADGKIERRYGDGRVEMIFRNGTRKVMSTDPSFGGSVSCTIYFSNGDVKRTDPSGTCSRSNSPRCHTQNYSQQSHTGTVTYFYAAANTTHTTRVDGVEIFEFPSGQKETHHVDGRKDIVFEDGTRKTIYPNKEEHSLFPDGTKVIEYPDGTKRVTSPDGTHGVEES